MRILPIATLSVLLAGCGNVADQPPVANAPAEQPQVAKATPDQPPVANAPADPVKVEPTPAPSPPPTPVVKQDPTVVPLNARVKSPDSGPVQVPLEQWYNSYVKNLKVVKTVNSVVITFDVDLDVVRANPGRYQSGLPLCVRLFDEDGHYLSHFITAEEFTTYSDHPLLGGRVTLLKDKGNAFTYSVQRRDLREAANVEVGFFVKDSPFRRR